MEGHKYKTAQFWEWAKHVKLYSDLLHASFDSSGFAADKDLISASTVCYRGAGERKIRNKNPNLTYNDVQG